MALASCGVKYIFQMKNHVDTARVICLWCGMDIIAHIRTIGKSVSSVCADAGISRPAFYLAIKPDANPQLDTLKAIARATGLTVADIRPEIME